MRRWVIGMLVMAVLALVCLPVLLFAAEAAPAAAPASLLTILMGIIATIVAGVVVWAATMLAKKFGIDLDAGKADALRKVAKDAVYFAEEWAARQLKVGDLAVAGSDKLQRAVGFVLAKIPGVDTEDVKNQIHAALGSIQELGASKTVGDAKTP